MTNEEMQRFEKELKARQIIQERNVECIYLRATLLSDGVHFKWKIDKSRWDELWEAHQGNGTLEIFRHTGPGDIRYDLDWRILNRRELEGEWIDYILDPERKVYKYLVLYEDGYYLYADEKDKKYSATVPLLNFSCIYPNKDYAQDYIEQKEAALKKMQLDKEYQVKEEIAKLRVGINKKEMLRQLLQEKVDEILRGKDIKDLPEEERAYLEDIIDKINFEIRKFEINP